VVSGLRAGEDTPEQLSALWEGAVDRSRSAVTEALDAGGLDGLLSNTPSGRPRSLRRLLVDMIEVDMIEEYARHTGHADLIRESVDGRVGEDPPGRPYPYQIP